MRSGIRDRIIRLLSGLEGERVPQPYIYKSLGASKSRVSEVLRELESEGLIQRYTVGKVNIVYVKPGAFSGLIERVEARRFKLGIVYSSEYMFLGSFAKNLRKRDVDVDVTVFKDGFEATRHLAEGLVDMVFSPFVGQLYLYPAYRTYRVIGNGGTKGGFRVLYRPGNSVAYSSMISTMDYARYLATKSGLIEASKVQYYKNPLELPQATKKGGYVITWHPVYLDLLSKLEYTTLFTHRDLNVDFCCTLAVSSVLGEDAVRAVSKAFISALEEYKKRPDKMLEYYSSLTGIEISTLKSAISEYAVADEISQKHVERVVSCFAPLIPDRSVYKEILHRDNH